MCMEMDILRKKKLMCIAFLLISIISLLLLLKCSSFLIITRKNDNYYKYVLYPVEKRDSCKQCILGISSVIL